jgi:6-phosphofructokinase 1
MDDRGKLAAIAGALGCLGWALYKKLQKPKEVVHPRPLLRQSSTTAFFGPNLTVAQLRTEEDKLKQQLQQELLADLELIKVNRIVPVDHLSNWCASEGSIDINPLLYKAAGLQSLGMPPECFVSPGAFCIKDYQFHNEEELKTAPRYMKAGPKKYLYFNKDKVCAALVTCGGLCPGLNVVIREIVMTLWYRYKVRNIWGIRWGYHGFYEPGDNYVRLHPDKVKDIHQLGGTMLGAGRDNFQLEPVLNAIIEKGFNQVYIIGGDGTHKGIELLAKEVRKRKLRIALIGVPKTIDNDIQIIDYSFGFASAVQAAVKAIDSANVEANCADRGVGIVKVMGRDVGYIAMHASLASRDVNICLVPEFQFDLQGERGLLKYVVEERLPKKNHCVIVVAEGAAVGVRDMKLVKEGEDARLIDIGNILKKMIENYAKERKLPPVIVKYIDPSYMIRTVPANSADRQFCSILAQNAVHGAMAGFTNFTCGIIRGISVNLPLELVANGQKNKLKAEDRGWQRLLAGTGQRSFLN